MAEAWKRYDGEFHHATISACDSRVLLDTHAAIYDRYLRYQVVVGLYRGEVANHEHRALLQHVLDRDWRAAQATLTTHVNDCVTHIESTGIIERIARDAPPPGRGHDAAPEAPAAGNDARARRVRWD